MAAVNTTMTSTNLSSEHCNAAAAASTGENDIADSDC